MILLVHMLFGAAVGSWVFTATNSFVFSLLAAFLSHYFLDLFPHIEYLKSTEDSIRKIKSKYWKSYSGDMLRVLADFSLGILAIFLLSLNQTLLYACALVAVLPDALTIVTLLFPNKLLSLHHTLHTQYIHYLTKQKKFPVFWRIFTQILAILISIYVLKY